MDGVGWDGVVWLGVGLGKDWDGVGWGSVCLRGG